MANPNLRKSLVPVFFGCDAKFLRFTAVALRSLINNTSDDRRYHIHILHTDVPAELQREVLKMRKKNVSITFEDVTADISDLVRGLPIRDYYSPSTYYRIVIASKFPQYNKAIYVDSDTVVVDDIAKLYDINIGRNYIAAVPEAVSLAIPEVGRYTEEVLGIPYNRYFNAGVVVINCKEWREHDVLGQFIQLSNFYNFSVAQDQDYLNVICKNRVYYLHRRWNMEAISEYPSINEKNYGIIHYAFAAKPWHDINAPYGFYFWKYASQTYDFDAIKHIWADYTAEQLQAEAAVADKVIGLCLEEIANPKNYLRSMKQVKHNRFEAMFPLLNVVYGEAVRASI